jgi:multidrug efflux pump subunit AcrB
MKKKITRSFKKNRKLFVKKSRFLLRHPLLVPVVIFVVLFFLGVVGFVAIGGSTKGASDARIVNIYADGEQQTVTTRAQTVGDLLQRLKLPLLPEDIVEPSKETVILEDNTQINIYRARP